MELSSFFWCSWETFEAFAWDITDDCRLAVAKLGDIVDLWLSGGWLLNILFSSVSSLVMIAAQIYMSLPSPRLSI